MWHPAYAHTAPPGVPPAGGSGGDTKDRTELFESEGREQDPAGGGAWRIEYSGSTGNATRCRPLELVFPNCRHLLQDVDIQVKLLLLRRPYLLVVLQLLLRVPPCLAHVG